MPIPSATYPFDPSGTLSSNLVPGEQHIITSVNYKDYNIIVPTFAPFFATSITIDFKDINANTVTLVENVDYYLTHWFVAASRACSKPIYGSLTLLNENISGVLTISYQTLGGDWNIDGALIAQIMADSLHNPRITTWDEVSDLPYAFPVIDHPWDLVDMVGMSEVVTGLEEIKQAILDSAGGGSGGSTVEQDLLNHTGDYNNPHNLTAAEIGALTKTLGDSYYLGITDQSADSGRLEGKTLTEVKQETLLGTAADSDLLEGHTYQEILDAASMGTIDNAEKFDNRTFLQATNEILSGTAADSERFNGMDQTEFTEHVEDLVADGVRVFKRVFPTYISTDTGSTNTWTLLSVFKNTPITTSSELENSVHLLVDVSGYITDTKDGAYEIIVNTRDPAPTLEVRTRVSGETGVEFGISYDSVDDDYLLWVKTNSDRSFINVVSLAGGNINSRILEDSVVTVEPATIDYTMDRQSAGFVTLELFSDFLVTLTNKFDSLTN